MESAPRPYAVAILFLAGTLTSTTAVAEEPARREARSSREDVYGMTSDGIHTIQAYEFVPASGAGANLISNVFGSRGCSTPCTLVAPVMLPSGSVIHELELEGCDFSATDMQAILFRQASLESGQEALAVVSTMGLNSCGFRHSAVPPHTVSNLNGTYRVEITMNDTTIATRFQAVRIWYRLQVSPAPNTARFPNDVPTTHPFFRFVEALAAAGITGGCGTGSYCPDAAVTRGQMAVFLATALGLHFPN